MASQKYAPGMRTVRMKNEGAKFPYKEYDDLFQLPPEQLEECDCFTKLELLRNNKVNRTLRDGRGHWKNQDAKDVVVNNVSGRVTKLKLYEDKKKPTEWHILEYMDTEKPEAGRYVLCHVYKLEKKNDSGRGDENQAECSNAQPNQIDDFDMDDESIDQLLLEFVNQDWPEL